jgi:3-oxoacyl-[acyl-carrier-protein] synthase-3
MAGVRRRYLADESVCSSDLCAAAAQDVMNKLDWSSQSIDALILVTQSPDYFLPSTACILQHKLGLSTHCLAFDIGLGCSGYPYGLMVVATMMRGKGVKRALLLHGETPARFAHSEDRSVALLFGDAGSATAIEINVERPKENWYFSLHSDGSGYDALIIRGGGFRNRVPTDPIDHYVHMDGANIFNFTIKRVPKLIADTLSESGMSHEQIDYFILDQSNKFIMRHLIKKIGVSVDKVPFTISEFGSAGGPSVPLTIANGNLTRPPDRALKLLLVAYGVGLSWGSALIDLPFDAILNHIRLDG